MRFKVIAALAVIGAGSAPGAALAQTLVHPSLTERTALRLEPPSRLLMPSTEGIARSPDTRSVSASTLNAQGAIDCTPGGHGPDCILQLAENQTTAAIHFRPSPPIVGASRISYSVLVLGTGEQDRVATGAGQIARYVWTGTDLPKDSVKILVQTNVTGVLQSDTIYLLPPRTTAIDSVYAQAYYPYAWLSNSWMPLTVRAQIKARRGDMTEARCGRVQIAFQIQGGGETEPDSAIAEWEPHQSGDGGWCMAETRWKLGDAGPHQLRLRMGDGTRVARSEDVLRAFARERPRIVAGVGYFTRVNVEEERFCPSYETVPTDCARRRTSAGDSIKREVEVERAGETATYFGVDFPLLLSNQPRNPISRFISRRTRLVVGSTFSEPDENFFVGVTVLPLFVPTSEIVSTQIHAGWRPSEGGFFVGASVDGSGLITNALKALGAPIS